MKIRSGFVSNSSSSSFILSITPKTNLEKENELLFKFFINTISESKQYADTHSHLPSDFDGTAGSYIELLHHEQEELEKDIEWAKQEVELLENISKNKGAVALFECWSKRRGNNNYPARYMRQSEESAKEYGWNSENLESEINRIERKIKRKKKDINNIETKVTKLLPLPPDSKIITVNIDYMDRNLDNLNEIFNSSWITIIDETHG